jgi:predicted aconitase with swiveling domain
VSAGDRRDRAIRGRVLAPGDGAGVTLVLGESLSLWGGLDPATGLIVDVRHPDRGATVTGRVLVMPAARGSSSSASVLAEAVRAGTAPSAIVLGEADLILAIGAAVAEELYGELVPIIVVDDVALARLRDTRVVAVEARDGVATITITDGRR